MEVNLLFFKKDGSFKSVPLPSNVTVLGRRRDCDLRVRLSSVSRRHCRISNDNGVLNLSDLKSRNGTILNGQSIKETQVKAGDKITMGRLTFVLQVNGKPEKIEVDNPSDDTSVSGELEISDDELFEDSSNLELNDKDL